MDAAADPSLLAFFRFDDPASGFTAADSTGHLPAAALAGDAVFVPGRIGNALHVDVDGWLNVGAIRPSPDGGATFDASDVGDALLFRWARASSRTGSACMSSWKTARAR